MAVAMPVFVALMLGVIEMSRLGMVLQILNAAAREGCRTAAINGSTQADVQARVDSLLNAAKIPVGTISVVASDPGSSGAWLAPSDWSSPKPGTLSSVTLTLRVPYSKISWLPTPRFIKVPNVSASVTMNNERP